MSVVKIPVLLNAAAMAEQFPDTFTRPGESILRQLVPLDWCKVCLPVDGKLLGRPTYGERFWVKLLEINFPFFIGRIDNNLLTNKLEFGDVIRFHADNIYDVMDCNQRPRNRVNA